MNDHEAPIWRRRLGQMTLAIGLGMAALGASGGGAEAAMVLPAAIVAPAGPAAIQPIYWTRDRFGRQVWVERHYRPPPPRYDYRDRRHQRRHGWVDRHGRWHPSR